MKPKKFLAVVSASGAKLSITAGEEVELDDPAIAADLTRAGYIVPHKRGLTLAAAQEIAAETRAAVEAEIAEADAAEAAAREEAEKAAAAAADDETGEPGDDATAADAATE